MPRSATWLHRLRTRPPQGIASPQHGDQLPHPRSEILALTGVRAAAALAVVLHHIGLPDSAPVPLRNLVASGYIGVPLFFMLSGLVLAWNYSTLTAVEGRRLWRFYLARIARVMPLYWVVLFFLVLQRAANGVPQEALWRHVLAIQTWSGDYSIGQGSYNPPGWSICVEIFLYAVFPLAVPVIAWLAKRYGGAGLVAVIAVAFAVQVALVAWFTVEGWAFISVKDPGSGHRWLYRNPLPRLAEFVIGISLAFFLLRGFQLRARVAGWIQAACVVVVLAIAATGPTLARWELPAFYGAMWTVPFAVLLLSLAACPSAWLSRFFATRILVTLGTASYAVYLTHRPLLPFLVKDRGSMITDPSGWAPYAGIVVVVGVCLLIGEGAHRLIEVPARRAILRYAGQPKRRPPVTERAPTEVSA
ncbi:peptidoglycan/LPS O-acetylase OafA/YrhL [Kribbella amoyensis]|uniref:Peptidoglycan/LPS O-acetylase OafA/YrhL n=1 Tax=Kribbella amoyensis TaxID=996641 RepID=A0A561BKX3_9ACTN|nr:acyltransferase [Kribbella amoyensis]TWD79528.1 peptidoglycan/LPS O-acetylase OafA/YrhL [Kribbella amoyensis]